MGKISKQTLEGESLRFLETLLRGALVAGILWFFLGYMDWYDPWIVLKPAVTVLGPHTEFLVEVGDKDAGLRDLQVSIHQGGLEKHIMALTFPAQGDFFGAKGSKISKMEIPFAVDLKALGLTEGKASLAVQVRDRSWRNRFQGRISTLTREVSIRLSQSK
jgi:hypothetical protein